MGKMNKNNRIENSNNINNISIDEENSSIGNNNNKKEYKNSENRKKKEVKKFIKSKEDKKSRENEKKRYNQRKAIQDFLISENGFNLIIDQSKIASDNSIKDIKNKPTNKSDILNDIDNIISFYSDFLLQIPIKKVYESDLYEISKTIEKVCERKEV